MLEIILLSITQGITEFLPVSSSAHLIIVSKFINFNEENLTLDISLHFGSLLAVLFFFKKEILDFLNNKSLFLKIIIASLPTIIFGYLLWKLNIIDQLRNINVIGFTTIFFGLLLYISDKSKTNKNIINDFKIKDSVYIGFVQILSLIPGVSRSGITITCARFLNFDRAESAKISFLLSIPTLLAVCSYNVVKIVQLNSLQITMQNFLGIILSFAFSLITLKIFISFLKKFSLIFFVFYRIFLGLLIFTI